MHRSRIISLLLLSLVSMFSAAAAYAQDDPNVQLGLHPFSAYSGGDIDTINLFNGGMNVDIPLVSYPQRGGKLKLNITLHYVNIGYLLTIACVGSGYTYNCGGVPQVEHGFSLYDEDLISAGAPPGQGDIVNSKAQVVALIVPAAVLEPNGSSHLALPSTSTTASTIYETTDATGFQVDMLNFSPPNGQTYDVQIDSAGTSYGYNFSTETYSRTDSNGNQISYSYQNGWIDTLGRKIPPIVALGDSANTLYNEVSYYGTAASSTKCTGPLPISAAFTWTPPGPNGGTYPITFCFVGLNDDVGDDSGTYNELQSIVLPNGMAWTFQYTQGTLFGYSFGENLSQVTFPTGGTLSYTWGTNTLADACNVGGYTYDIYNTVATRTLNPNDGITPPSVWTYTYVTSTSSTPQQTIVSAPPSNGSTPDDTVHTFGLGQCVGDYETAAQYYQGSHTTGTLLKTVNTQYSSTNLGSAWKTIVPLVLEPINITPAQKTTTWANGQAATTTYTYDQKFVFCWPDIAINPTTGVVGGFYTGGSTCGSSGSVAVSYGMLLSQADYDYSGALLRTKTTNYLALNNSAYLAANLIDLPSSVQVTGSGPGLNTTYGYDASGCSSGVCGNQTSVNGWLNTTGTYLTTSKVYNSNGLVTSSTDPKGNTTTYGYSSGYAGSGPTSVTNALNQTTTKTYDFNTGLLTSTTDPNNQTTNYQYDEMLRTTQINYPNGGQTILSYPTANNVDITEAITNSSNRLSYLVVDGVGREIREAVTNGESLPYDEVDTCYNGNGLVGFKSYPFQDSGPFATARTCASPELGDSFTYDALRRTTNLTHSDNSYVSTSYSGSSTTVTDEQGKTRQSSTDGLGRLTQVIENPGGLGYTTAYTYDALDDLTGVTQAGSRQRTFVYDSLARLTSSTNPESNWSPTNQAYVATTYSYDADSNLINKTEPAQNQQGTAQVTLTYCFDALNRMTAKGYTAQTCSNGTMPSPVATYSYDQSGCLGQSACYNIGRRTGMTDAAGSESWAYDPMGREITAQRTTNSLTNSAVYQYNLLGSPTTIAYPSGRVVSYGYNLGNRPISATDNTTFVNYANAAHYWANGAPCWTVYGSAVTGATTFNGRSQPLEMQATGSAVTYSGPGCPGLGSTGNLLDLSFIFNYGSGDNGNVMGITNNRDSTRSQGFTYDALNRLLQATASTYASSPSHCWGEAYVYDNNASGGAWGNLTNINSAGTAYNGCAEESLSVSATAQNQISNGSTYGYDTAGNMTTNGSITYTFDAENHLTSTAGVTYTYDGDGNRVEKSNGKIYWYGIAGEVLDETDLTGSMTDSNFSEYVFFDGKLIARHDASNNVYYYNADHLGTSRVIAEVPSGSTTATLCYDADFYPFGGERAYTNTCSQNYKFTGKERDSESNLDNFSARYDSSSIGRFMSPDLLGGKRTDPQTLNKYSYVRNSPLTLTDPTGLYTCADDQNKCQTAHDTSFEAARQNDLKSKDPDVLRAAKAYGDPTKDNGVNVSFQDMSKGSEGGTTTSTIGVDANGNLRANSNVVIDSNASGAVLDAEVGHEGSHVADAQDVVASGLTENGDKIYAGENITPYSSEQRAYGVTNSILQKDNEKVQFNCGMSSTCTLGPGTIPGQISGIVDQILRSNPSYNVNGKPMSSTNQGISVVNGVNGEKPNVTVPH